MKAGRVDLYKGRPDSLVYFEHCVHVLDVKVLYTYALSTSICKCFVQMCNCQDVSFGTPAMKEILSSCIHGQASQGRAVMSSHTDTSFNTDVSVFLDYINNITTLFNLGSI